MKHLFTSSQVALALGVSESTLKRWCNQGLLKSVRTCGGHRRVPLSEIIEFLKQTQQSLANPEILGLSKVEAPAQDDQSLNFQLFSALAAGQEEQIRSTLIQLFLNGWSIARLADELVSPLLAKVGEAWGCGEIQVYQERRGCNILQCVLRELRSMLPAPESDGPKAIGGTFSTDNYEMPNALAELVLRERGWNAQSLGLGLPADTFSAAIHQTKPRLVWLSVSVLQSEKELIDQFTAVAEAAKSERATLAVGGQGLTVELRRKLPVAIFCESMAHLAQTSDQIWTRPPKIAPKLFEA